MEMALLRTEKIRKILSKEKYPNGASVPKVGASLELAIAEQLGEGLWFLR